MHARRPAKSMSDGVAHAAQRSAAAVLLINNIMQYAGLTVRSLVLCPRFPVRFKTSILNHIVPVS
jgi:hypothetical protein